MRTLFLALATTFFAGSALAETVIAPNTSINTEVVTTHKWDAATTAMTINPVITYTGLAEDFTVTLGTKLNVWDNTNKLMIDDELDHAPTLDLGLSYFATAQLELEALASYDFNAKKREEIKFVASFNF
tara:strand:+ start:1047 stop:1433 length:387 start_codon:yes stop_codon:yes gene_type:complete